MPLKIGNISTLLKIYNLKLTIDLRTADASSVELSVFLEQIYGTVV